MPDNQCVNVAAFLSLPSSNDGGYDFCTELLNGDPVYSAALRNLCRSDRVDSVFLLSDSEEVLAGVHDPKCSAIKPVDGLSFSDDFESKLRAASNLVQAEYYIFMRADAPFIKEETIITAVNALERNASLATATLAGKRDVPALCIAKGSPRGQCGHLKLESDDIERLCVTDAQSLTTADEISRGRQVREFMYFHAIKSYFTSSAFADLLFEFGVGSFVPNMRLNLPGKKIMGRANTLKLRRVREGENYDIFYEKALGTYNRMKLGDVIVVENELSDRAYFGELNAHLAIRAGAVATIIGGFTRDIDDVSRLDYPVFSTGYSCGDMRRIATFESHNQPIKLLGIDVNPGDLIFADINGVVVIPQSIEQIMLKKAVETVHLEKNVLNLILAHHDARDIHKKLGDF